MPTNVATHLIANRDIPFNDPSIRRATMLGLDRHCFINMLSEGKAFIAGAMMPLPNSNSGMPADMLEPLPGYAGARQAEARAIQLSPWDVWLVSPWLDK